MEKLLEVHNIHKTFYRPTIVEVLRGISLSIQEEETVAIMGASGEGKSTLLHILGTLEPPSKGIISIAGQSLRRKNRASLRNKHIGFVFQSYNLLDDYTALENVLMPARIGRIKTSKGSDAYIHAEELLEMVGLSERAHFPAKLLSGGEKQRVAIARAMCNDPEILLADEPTGNLDHKASQEIHELLISCTERSGSALVVVTHDLELAALCKSSYRLQNGRLRKEK